jgi:DNA polymerase III alpha subunit (gram-positive type)
MYQITKDKKKVYNIIDHTELCARYINGDHTLICYDTETTGVKEGSFPVQISAIKMKRINGGPYQIVDTLNVFIKPPISMPLEASSVNGLTDEFLADKPTEAEVFQQVKDFFGDVADPDNGPVIFGYNSMSFDTKKIMNPFYIRNGDYKGFVPAREFDSYNMAKELLDRSIMPVGSDGKQHLKLIDVAALYNIKGEHFHDARTDIEVTIKVTWALYNDYCYTFQSFNWADKPHIEITGCKKFNPSQWVNYIYYDVIVDGKKGRVHFDKRGKRYIEDSGDVFSLGNMLVFEKEAPLFAKEHIA